MITVAGSCIADFFVRTVRRAPHAESLELVEHVGFHTGGSVSNTGGVLARLGVPVSVVTRLGDDPIGDLMATQLSRWATRQTLVRDPVRPTSASVAHVFANGDRGFLVAAGACDGLEAADLDLAAEARAGSRAFHLGYALLLPGLDGLPMARLFQRAGELGLLTSLDMAYFPGPDWSRVRPLLPFVDVFCPNRREATAVTGETDPEASAAALLAAGVRQFVAIKDGENGAFLRPASGNGETGRWVAPHRVPAVDGTGAGDAFVAGLLAAWHRGLDWFSAGRIANAAGALATTRHGAAEGVDSWEQTVDLCHAQE